MSVTVDESKCDGNGACKEVCPADVFEIQDGKAKVVAEDACIACHACEDACPKKAITVTD